jgi:hypothetical protein
MERFLKQGTRATYAMRFAVAARRATKSVGLPSLTSIRTTHRLHVAIKITPAAATEHVIRRRRVAMLVQTTAAMLISVQASATSRVNVPQEMCVIQRMNAFLILVVKEATIRPLAAAHAPTTMIVAAATCA